MSHKKQPPPPPVNAGVKVHPLPDSGGVAGLMSRLRQSDGSYAPPPGDPTGTRLPSFREWSPQNYHELHNRLLDLQREFAAFPASFRSRFGNDPYQVIRFIDDPANRIEAVRLGLVEPTDEEALALYRARQKKARVVQLDIEDEIATERARQARVKAAENPPPPAPASA